ncbi:MAG TPA: hypothetical protein DDY59_09590 [Lachnospiraceae bacterium]|nr:hypothetical protein [Lachnospiraceae bacterium]
MIFLECLYVKALKAVKMELTQLHQLLMYLVAATFTANLFKHLNEIVQMIAISGVRHTEYKIDYKWQGGVFCISNTLSSVWKSFRPH